MKVYEKPRMNILALEGNDCLSGNCTPFEGAYIQDLPSEILGVVMAGNVDKDNDDYVTREEIQQANLFAPEENCGTPVSVYCKYTSSGISLAWS